MALDASWLSLAFFVAWTLLKLPRTPPICRHKSIQAQTPGAEVKIPRSLKPRSEDDGPLCRGAKRKQVKLVMEGPIVKPWRELKSPTGRPKQIRTEGFACANSACLYFGVKDAQLHALVGDGKAGETEPNQTWGCQACQKTFSARRHTPLYA